MEQKRVEEKKKKIGEKGDSFKKKNPRRDGMEPPLPSPQALDYYAILKSFVLSVSSEIESE